MSAHVNGSGKPRFELPALEFNFGSITDGTIIPPPPESPKVPTPPHTPPPANKPNVIAWRPVENGLSNQAVKETQTDDDFPSINGHFGGLKRPADEAPLSPAGSTRQGSLRRLFSKNMLNANYAEGNFASLEMGSRPASRGAHSLVGGRKSKRNSLFKFFRSGESKRASMFLENTNTSSLLHKEVGPPPPMIPELRELEKDEGSLGNDLFKNING
ncbi:hypothetical protein E4U42_001578 [Claviceps africana]|uniref:Uncharacterized protein n=1 Tax=Claviceps africana TaxID=83212 RepID=A0A8K0J1K6_9HYPO|nr:hypothetical protein E4U42_001578 [Claviceps africana]